jgi:hypothetical protein
LFGVIVDVKDRVVFVEEEEEEEEEEAFCGRSKSERERCVCGEKKLSPERETETECVCVGGGVWMGSVRRVCVLYDVEVCGIVIAQFWFWRLGAAK